MIFNNPNHEESRDKVCDYPLFSNTSYCQQQSELIIACGGGTSRLFTAKEIDFLYFNVIYLCIAAFAITTSNFVIIYTIACSDKLKNSRGFIKFSIALADLILGIIVLPHSILKSVSVFQFASVHWETPENCFFAILYAMSRSAAMQSAVLLLFDCWVQTSRPSVYEKMFTKRDCIPIISAVWVVAFISSISSLADASKWPCHLYQIITTPTAFGIPPNVFQTELDIAFFIGFIFPMIIGVCLMYMINGLQRDIRIIFTKKYRHLGRRASFIALENVTHVWNSQDGSERNRGIPIDIKGAVMKSANSGIGSGVGSGRPDQIGAGWTVEKKFVGEGDTPGTEISALTETFESQYHAVNENKSDCGEIDYGNLKHATSDTRIRDWLEEKELCAAALAAEPPLETDLLNSNKSLASLEGKRDSLARNCTKNPRLIQECEDNFRTAMWILIFKIVLFLPVIVMIILRMKNIVSISDSAYAICGAFVAHAAHVTILVYSFVDPEMGGEIRQVFRNIKAF